MLILQEGAIKRSKLKVQVKVNFFSYDILAMVSAGSDGQVKGSYLQKLELSRNAKDGYPLELIKLMTRYAEDLVWSNNITKAEKVFNFILSLTEGRQDASQFRKGKFIHDICYP